MENIGSLLTQIYEKAPDEETRVLVRKLENACGSAIGQVKDEIMSAAEAECENSVVISPDPEKKYVSILNLQRIVMDAGRNI